ncbi:UNVERIFIED_CONTAM: hypothetical protein Scaly_0312900, partial [Sesamum calycinum]
GHLDEWRICLTWITCIDRSPILVSHAASDLNTERDESGSFKVSLMDQRYRPIIPIPSVNSHVNFMVDHATISRSSSLGNEIPLLNVENTDSAVDVMPSRTEETVDFAHLFKEEYCNKPEVGTDEMDNSGNSHEEENLKMKDGLVGCLIFLKKAKGFFCPKNTARAWI